MKEKKMKKEKENFKRVGEKGSVLKRKKKKKGPDRRGGKRKEVRGADCASLTWKQRGEKKRKQKEEEEPKLQCGQWRGGRGEKERKERSK